MSFSGRYISFQVEKEREPRKRDWDKEHVEALEKARAKEADFRGEIRQCNEGKFDFSMNEDDEVPGAVVVRVKVPKYLDMSLINVDPHPLYVIPPPSLLSFLSSRVGILCELLCKTSLATSPVATLSLKNFTSPNQP